MLLDEISWMSQDAHDFAGYLKIAWIPFSNVDVILILCSSVSTWIGKYPQFYSFVGQVSLTISLEELSLSNRSNADEP